MTRSEWKQAWHIARLYGYEITGISPLSLRIRAAWKCLQSREARSAELGLSLSPTSDK
ncbi:hypothetical protein [Stenotrophomonas maltophilia]|uniref:hypothetical protein n=1 Tax=Stenotrophomonas maltophilia TaxID=40324 RepID=UPI002893E02E|nr:hypothetical protein [Stenotrophomonas maltophilia]MDT3472904.1 hypothetical protein [Stenotrophomonas maltophilia]HEL5316249.1 hypothetical protein [Stenotrophomonas maltophilia]HEL5344808.1 hypothetical protein [Stenotrophomonas maltophilia]